jgi:ubiquinone/menaquinone biosynthesis C-methylase UbiE
MEISSQTMAGIRAYYQKNYFGVPPKSLPLDIFIQESISDERTNNQTNYIRKFPFFTTGKKILDAGSGLGLDVITLKKLGYDAYGYEVDPELYKISSDIALSEGYTSIFLLTENDKIPLDSNSFDIAYSNMVLEHVKDIRKYFAEVIRVLKPGGHFIVITCNYSLSYEFHYQLLLPIFSRSLSKIVLKIFGRNTKFLDQINFVTPKKVEAALKNLAITAPINWVDIGRQEFLSNINNPKAHSKRFLDMARIFTSLHLEKVLVKCGLYNPLVYVITKD